MFNRDAILQYLNKKGWSKYRLSKESGIAQTTLYDILSGKKVTPNVKTLQKIADALGVSVNEFFKEDNKDNEVYKIKYNENLCVKEQEALEKEARELLDNLTISLSQSKDYLEEEDYKILEASINSALQTIKLKNKEKYTPKKYKE